MTDKEITLISKEVKGIYLSYVNGEYLLFIGDKVSKYDKSRDPQELYDNFIVSNSYDDYDNQVKLLILSIESNKGVSRETAKEIFAELMEDLYTLYFNPTNMKETELKNIMAERFQEISNNNVKERFQKQMADFEKSKYIDIEKSIKENLQSRKSGDVEIARRELSKYLTIKYGAILRKNIGDIYLIDGDGFIPISHDDLMLKLKNDFGDNFIHDNDLKNAIGYISDRREPAPNIVKFKNTLYDMDNLQPLETDKPLFTLLQVNYDLNPNAESVLFKNFLYSSFERETPAETERAVKGIFQISGYFFTSGNKYNILPIFTGLTGAGKSTFFNIITAIFGDNKISGVSLQELEKDTHAGAEFIESHLNIIRDSDTTMIENNSILKNWTGNESFRVNPKYKPPATLPPAEVPKPILVCNTMPVFKVYEPAIVSRFLIVEFKKSFRHSKDQIADLDKLIIADKSEMEWFIYQSITAYREMVENGENFIFKITDDETMELVNKHTHPLNHIIRELILKHDPQAYQTEKDINPNGYTPIYTNDLVEAILLFSEKSAIDVPTDKHGRINKKKLLNVIKEEFDLYDGEIVKNKNGYDTHREYKPTAERCRGRHGKTYPNLIATPTYHELIKEIEAKKRENKDQ